MNVLGIDPGSHVTGWGAVRVEGSRILHMASGIVAVEGDDLATRLLAIAEGLEAVLAQIQPAAVAVETVFFAKNSQSALKLGQARGVALLCAARSGAPVFEYTAGQIKQAVTGHGRAEKEQVQQMVQLLLRIAGPMALDASDALAAAICHTHMAMTPTAAYLRSKVVGRR